MTNTTDRLKIVANRQKWRAKGDVLFSLLYVGVGLGNVALLLSL